MVKVRLSAMAFLGLLLSAAPLVAQTTGSVSGTIKDNSGAVVPGVAVTVENVETKATRTAVSGDSGTYQIALLPPGRYRVRAELQGFRTEERDLTLVVSQNARFDFAMNLGSLEETITVQAAAPLVDTRDAAMGQVVDQTKIVELPLNGRNFRDLGLIAPGVQQQTQASGLASRGGGLYINGARIYDNNYLLDGFDNNDTTTGEILTFPSPDAIQEFKVLGASYGAEYGFASGGIISLISKSGGSSYRGNVFGFVRNDAMDARNYFATSVPKLDRRQGGGTIGGPVWGGKTFFFGSYEKTNLTQGQPFTAAVPSDAQRGGNFGSGAAVRDPLTGLPFPGNVIPTSRFNARAVGMLPLFPQANNPGDPTRNYVSAPNLLDDLHVGSGRLDYNLSPSNQFTARYSIYWDTQSNPGAVPAVVTAVRKQNQSVGATWTHVFGSNTVQEVRAGIGHVYNGMYRDDSTALDWGKELGIGGTLQQAIPDRLGQGPPVLTLTGFSPINPNNNPFIRTHNLRQVSYVLAQTAGNHSVKAGGEVRTQQMALDDWRNPQGTFTFTGRYTGNAMGDFLLGFPSQTTTFTGLVFMEQVNWQTALFVQDEWRLSPRLTVNYGIRYEYQAPDREVENRWGTFEPALAQSVQVGTNGVPETIRSAEKDNFAPRVGMVWDISGDGKRALRAGYGVYYTSFVHNIAFSSYANTPLGANRVFAASATAPNISLSDPFPSSFGTDTITTSGMERDFPQGKVHRWSLDLQQELGRGSMVSLGYVGSQSVDLTRQYNINQPVLGAGSIASRRPYPNLGDITWTDGTGRSNYNSLETKFQRRMQNGFDLLVAYTLSKAIDDGVVSDDAGSGVLNSYDREAERGLSAWDRRHRFVTSGSYLSPFQNALARGWQLSAIFTLTSGSPFTPVMSSDVAGIGNLGNQRPNLAGDPGLSGDERSPNRWFNTAAFVSPATGTFGNAGRNILTGPGVNTLDTAVSRRFTFPKDVNVQVRLEMFNVLNHANFLLPNRTVDSPLFGTISGAGPARQGQIGVKVAW